MKRILTIMVLMLSAFSLRAQDNPDETEVIVEEVTQSEEEGPTLRAPSVVPITCFYYLSMETVVLSFVADLGNLDITVYNQTTGDSTYYFHSGTGTAILPIQDEGLIVLDIVSSSGRRFRAVIFV